MNILLITIRADYGGGPQHVDLLINNYPKEANIYVACPQDKPYYDMWKNNNSVVEIFELPHRKFSFLKLIGLCKFVKKHRIQIVHSHGKGGGVYSRLLKMLCPCIKITHTLHGFQIGQYSVIKKNIYIFIEKFFAKLTDKFINVSYGEQKLCLNNNIFPKDKSVVIHNGISQLKKAINAKQSIGLENKFIITTISRFDYQKNMQLAYEIAKRFLSNKNIIFLWVGDGDDKNALEQLAKQENVCNIIFIGFSQEIALYLSASDIYLSTSRWEGLPIALIEAQSIGLPIVASDVVGNNEVVIDKENGFLFDDIGDACESILKLYNNQSLYLQYAKSAINHFNSTFQIKHMINKNLKIYNDLLQ